jgi:hypothetical protein
MAIHIQGYLTYEYKIEIIVDQKIQGFISGQFSVGPLLYHEQIPL